MVWYVPPLSPIVDLLRDQGHDAESTSVLFGAIEALRIPVEYLAELLSAGDTAVITGVLRKLGAMRSYLRDISLGQPRDEAKAVAVGMTGDDLYAMYRLLAIAKYEERYVIPLAHKELANDELYTRRGADGLDFAASHATAADGNANATFYSTEDLNRTARELYEQGASSAACSLDFEGGPGGCGSAETPGGNRRNRAFYAMKDELEKKARELGGKVQAPNVQLFKSKKDFEAFHLKGPRGAGA